MNETVMTSGNNNSIPETEGKNLQQNQE